MVTVGELYQALIGPRRLIVKAYYATGNYLQSGSVHRLARLVEIHGAF